MSCTYTQVSTALHQFKIFYALQANKIAPPNYLKIMTDWSVPSGNRSNPRVAKDKYDIDNRVIISPDITRILSRHLYRCRDIVSIWK